MKLLGGVSLTKEQKELLHYCIDQAKGFGECKYANESGTAPQCVVGQILYLNGWHPEQLKFLDVGAPLVEGTFQYFGGGKDIEFLRPHIQASDVGGVPFNLLRRLQAFWDLQDAAGPEEARKRMHEIVEGA